LRLAARLAAAIEKTFGITAKLIEGHNGIYEVTVNKEIIYTNQGRCSQLPTDREILGKIRQYKESLPGEDLKMTEFFPIFNPKC
jgi:hypothetical protein